LKESGVAFTALFTSVQTRAIRTGNLALDAADLSWLPVTKDWRLNERHYGALTGLNKQETAAQHGEAQVLTWRRSYDVPPPPLARGGTYDLSSDRRYEGVTVPTTESLKLTLERVLPYWTESIAPLLVQGGNIIVAAHGNSLRAIVKHLYGLADEAIVHVEIPTGNPLLLELDGGLNVRSARYLDAARAEKLPA
jgi:2,3-bisphosphoglycerate-dependent phosphoglycerate mutase